MVEPDYVHVYYHARHGLRYERSQYVDGPARLNADNLNRYYNQYNNLYDECGKNLSQRTEKLGSSIGYACLSLIRDNFDDIGLELYPLATATNRYSRSTYYEGVIWSLRTKIYRDTNEIDKYFMLYGEVKITQSSKMPTIVAHNVSECAIVDNFESRVIAIQRVNLQKLKEILDALDILEPLKPENIELKAKFETLKRDFESLKLDVKNRLSTYNYIVKDVNSLSIELRGLQAEKGIAWIDAKGKEKIGRSSDIPQLHWGDIEKNMRWNVLKTELFPQVSNLLTVISIIPGGQGVATAGKMSLALLTYDPSSKDPVHHLDFIASIVGGAISFMPKAAPNGLIMKNKLTDSSLEKVLDSTRDILVAVRNSSTIGIVKDIVGGYNKLSKYDKLLTNGEVKKEFNDMLIESWSAIKEEYSKMNKKF